MSTSEISEPHAWLRHAWLWDAFYGAAGVLTVVVIWSAEPALWSRIGAAGLVGALALWYAGYGRRLIHLGGSRPHRLTFVAGQVVLLLAAALLVPAASVALLALVPQAFDVLPPLRAWPTVGVLALLFTAGFAPLLLSPEGMVGPLLVVGLVFVMVMPYVVWHNRIIAQSAERADLIEQLRASRAEVARLSHAAGVMAERQRLANDLHDTLTQGLSSLVMLVQSADAALDRDPAQARQDLALAARTARENLSEARALVAALTPTDLASAALPEAMQRLAARAATPVAVTVTGPARPLPMPVEVVLLRAAQESLTNVDKHASARRARVSLAYGAEAVVLEVVDDGRGFVATQPAGGYGLSGMRARATQVDGTMTVDSSPGSGTTVLVRVPA